MKPGPKKKPTALRLLEGNPSKRPLNESEPVCEFPATKPAIVARNEIASAEWNRLMAAMPPGLYTAADVPVLTTYALAWAMLAESQRLIQLDGITITTPKGRTAHPATRSWKQAVDTLAKCADRLGLHPGARAGLDLPKRGDRPSRWEGLLGRSDPARRH